MISSEYTLLLTNIGFFAFPSLPVMTKLTLYYVMPALKEVRSKSFLYALRLYWCTQCRCSDRGWSAAGYIWIVSHVMSSHWISYYFNAGAAVCCWQPTMLGSIWNSLIFFKVGFFWIISSDMTGLITGKLSHHVTPWNENFLISGFQRRKSIFIHRY